VLQDSLTIVCDQLGNGKRRRGIAKLLAHPDDNPVGTALVRRLIRT
jgi:hypothetical protein